MSIKRKAAGTGQVPMAAAKLKLVRNFKTNPDAAKSNSASAQRQRILKALRKRPLTTLQARKRLDVLAPPARVMELPLPGSKRKAER